MTACSSKSISPDSVTGMIFAMEGIRNVIVLLNGPMGCKFYHSTTSGFLAKHPPLRNAAGESVEQTKLAANAKGSGSGSGKSRRKM